MTWTDLSPIFVSVGVVVAIIGALVNIFVVSVNNRHLRKLDKEKRMAELIHYKYTKLYSILEDIENEQGFANYIDDLNRTIKEADKKRQRFISLYHMARPLISGRLREALDETSKREKAKYEKVSNTVFEKNIDAYRVSVGPWAESLNQFYRALSKAVQEQIITLVES